MSWPMWLRARTRNRIEIDETNCWELPKSKKFINEYYFCMKHVNRFSVEVHAMPGVHLGTMKLNY